MTDEEIDAELERLLDSEPEGFEGCERFKTWRQVFDFLGTTFYLGSTWRKIRKEAAAFLGRRQQPGDGGPRVFTPMITHPNGKRLTILEAEEFGFMFVPFFKNVSMYNCVRLEWTLQRKYDFLKRDGRRRLWFVSGSGREYEDEYGFCMVYVSLSFGVQAALDCGKLVRGRDTLSIPYDKMMKQGMYYQKSDEAGDEDTVSDSDDKETSDTDDEET
jgi:hypothetical protein